MGINKQAAKKKSAKKVTKKNGKSIPVAKIVPTTSNGIAVEMSPTDRPAA